MKKTELKFRLLINLRNRMECNKMTRLWSLKGSITPEEYEALDEAINSLREKSISE